jgi:hypothetical protein
MMRHGHARKKRSPEYQSWMAMMTRCHNASCSAFRHYGGRGITVCARWRLFENFLADMGPRPPGLTLERRDNDGNYEPGNCRWATRSDQVRNRRPTRQRPGSMPRGEGHHAARLSAQQVRDIRANKALCRVTLQELGARYGISTAHAGDIVARKKWAHV